MTVTVGIDVGGTFTDLILVDDQSGSVRISKVPSTLDNQAYGVLEALRRTGIALEQVDSIVHGTTTTTNAVLERKLARVGLITTEGFRDILELGRRTRPQAYGLTGSFVPLIPRELRREVAERMDAQGQVLVPLDEAAFVARVRELADSGVEALVIHFLHSYANPAHELRALELARQHWPNQYITAGHAIISEFREFERGTAAAVNASVQPILDRYIDRLQGSLSEAGFRSDLLVMQGNGGTVSARAISRTAINTVMSGPASGVMAAAYSGRLSGYPNLITYDMGGTSSDVALIENGMPKVSSELELEYGMPLHVPMVDVHTVGAGGGSIARVQAGGLLRVGPDSAGARPGPICYGRGGELPTLTDANLVLGRLDPQRLLAVDRAVTVDEVAGRIEAAIGKPLGLDAVQAAAAILQVGNNNMAGAVRLVSLARGYDPRDFALFAFGGAGPLHAVALARELAIPTVLIPVRPGLTNALGCLVADVRHDFVKSFNRPLKDLRDEDLADCLREQIAQGRAAIARDASPSPRSRSFITRRCSSKARATCSPWRCSPGRPRWRNCRKPSRAPIGSASRSNSRNCARCWSRWTPAWSASGRASRWTCCAAPARPPPKPGAVRSGLPTPAGWTPPSLPANTSRRRAGRSGHHRTTGRHHRHRPGRPCAR